MPNSSASRRFLSGRLGLLIVAVAVSGLLLFAALLSFGLGVYTLRSEVRVVEGFLWYPDILTLTTPTCHKAPGVSLLRETDVDVQVKVVASSHPFLRGGDDCQDAVEVKLQEPLGDRVVVDKHTEQSVSVSTINP